MTMMVIPVGPVSPYSSDPVADARALMAQNGLPSSAISWMYWNDPPTAPGQGTGRWQFQGIAYFTPPGAADQAMYVVSCAGNASTSVGGAPAAPAPAFTGMTKSNGPLFGIGLVPVVGTVGGLNSALINTVAATNPATLINDITNLIFPNNQGSWWVYYNDPQTAVGQGTGIWRLRVICIWTSAGAASLTSIYQAGGCALNSAGGAPATPPPASFGSKAVRASNLFPFL